MSDLWVIAPVYNEEKNLHAFVLEWICVLRKVAGENFTFCLMNDGSTDGSLTILNTLAATHPELRVIDKVNTGHGATCLAGYEQAIQAGAQWIFQIDSDGQCDPAYFETFWKSKSKGTVHFGRRLAREDGWSRRFISSMFSIIIFLLSLKWVRDPNVPYRLMRRDALTAALGRIPRNFRLTNALLAVILNENPGIAWHDIPFRKRPGRQMPLKITYFLREAVGFIADYISWMYHDQSVEPPEKVVMAGKILLVLFAGYYLVAFFVLGLIMIFAPFQYDWIEGVQLMQIHRLLAGKPLYTAPSLEYVSILYGPLHIYVSSFFVYLFGESYTSVRFVSFLAAMGTGATLSALVWKKTRSGFAAWLAAGFYAGMYGIVDMNYTMARVDSLYIFLTVVFAYTLRVASEKGGRWVIFAALAATGAVLTKQPALVCVFALCLWSLFVNNAQSRIAAVLCAIAVLISLILPSLAGNPWFFFFLYEMPSAHPLILSSLKDFLYQDLFKSLGFGLLLTAFVFYLLFKKTSGKRDAFFFLIFFAAMMLAGLAPRIKVGGGTNNLLPIAAATALCCGLSAGLLQYVKGRGKALVVVLLICFNIQILYNPLQIFPATEARKHAQIVEVFRGLEAPVFAPCHPYISILAGKNESAFWGAIYDVLITPGKQGERLREELRKALKEQRFRTVVLTETFFMWEAFPYAQLEASYQKMDPPNARAHQNRMVIYVPKN